MAKVSIVKDSYSIEGLFQWDTAQVLEIYGLSLGVTPTLHFSHEGASLAIVQPATMDASGVIRATVPDVLLEKTARICAYVCDEQGGDLKTLYKIVIPVTGRAKPADYQPDEKAYIYAMLAMDLEVVTLDADAQGYVEKVMDGDKMALRFNVPRGLTGITPRLHVIVNEVDAGEPPRGTITGTPEDPVLTLGIPAKDTTGGRYPKIWYADIERSSVLAGELWPLSGLSGLVEATIDTVHKYDIVISSRDGGVLYISQVFDNYWGDTTKPCCGFDIEFAGYLPGYPPALTVGFSEGCDFICDGVDDQVEIMEALKALPPLGGKIWFEGGTYNLSAAIQPRDESNGNYHLGDVELYCNVDSRAHFMGNYTGGFWRGMFGFFDAERITMRNFSLESNPARTGIELGELSRGARLENLILSGFEEAIAMRNWTTTNVLEIVACRITGTTLTSIGAYFAHVKDCYISGGTYGVAASEGGSNSMVQNCVILDVENGVYLNQPGAVISGNTIRASSNPVVSVADKGAVVAGNTFVGVDVTKESGNTYLGNTFTAE